MRCLERWALSPDSSIHQNALKRFESSKFSSIVYCSRHFVYVVYRWGSSVFILQTRLSRGKALSTIAWTYFIMSVLYESKVALRTRVHKFYSVTPNCSGTQQLPRYSRDPKYAFSVTFIAASLPWTFTCNGISLIANICSWPFPPNVHLWLTVWVFLRTSFNEVIWTFYPEMQIIETSVWLWVEVDMNTSLYLSRISSSSTIMFVAMNALCLSFLVLLLSFCGGGESFPAGLFHGGYSAWGLSLRPYRHLRHLWFRSK